MIKQIVKEISKIEEEGGIPTFNTLLDRVKISSRTLSKYLKLLESDEIIIRKRVGELKPIALNLKKAEQLLKSYENEIIWEKFRKKYSTETIELARDALDFLEILTETLGKKKIGNEFFDLTYQKFFARYKIDILSMLLRLAELEPLTQKQATIYYTLFWFLRNNVKTFPLPAFIFFPLYDIDEAEKKKLSTKMQTIMDHISRFVKTISTPS